MVFDNDSIRRILHLRRRDCVQAVELWHRLRLTDTDCPKKTPLVRPCCEAEDMGNQAQGRSGTSLLTASLHLGEHLEHVLET